MPDVRLDAKRLRNFRQARGMTQVELSTRGRIWQSYISRLERGGHPRASLATVGALAQALDVPINALLVKPLRDTYQPVTSELLEVCISEAHKLTREQQDQLAGVWAACLELLRAESSHAQKLPVQ